MTKVEMRKCRDKGIQCSYGICDECLVTINPSALDEEEDVIIIPQKLNEFLSIGNMKGRDNE